MFSTGVPELDKILEGGYPDKSAILLVGASGSGKEILAYRFMKAGRDQGDRCLYITGFSMNEVLIDMKAHSIELEPSSLSWISAGEGEKMFQPEDLAGLSFDIKDSIAHEGDWRTRVVVDSLSSLLSLNSADSIYRFLGQLLPELRRHQICFLAVLEEGMHDSRTIASMEQLFDGVLELGASEEDSSVKVLRVEKMRGLEIQSGAKIILRGKVDHLGSNAVLSRIAVLPLKNISPNPNDEYFSDGLHEELISTLSKVSGFTVISRTSVALYKDKPKPLDQVGRELKAGTILEGSVRKAGNRIRFTIQMIDAARDEQLWSETYDRELQDIFAVQSDVAQRVADSLSIRLHSSERRDIEKRPTESTDAYQLYLKGRYHLTHGWADKRKDNQMAMRYFEEALELDPQCAPAHAGISDCYHAAAHAGWFPPEEAYPKMRERAKKAIELDPRLAEAHAALGAEYMHYEWKWRQAEEELKKAIELKPSYDLVYGIYSYFVAIMGRFDEENEMIKRANELDPISGSFAGLLGPALWRTGRRGEAIDQLQRLVENNPESPFGHDALGFAYYRLSRIDQAVSELRKAASLAPESSTYQADMAYMFALVGRRDEANFILGGLKEQSKRTYVSGVQIACILYTLGRYDEAFESLEGAFGRRAIDLPDVRLMPEMTQLCEDKRWIFIENRMGLPHLRLPH